MGGGNKLYKQVLIFCALFIPFYMIYYRELYEQPKSVFAGKLLNRVFIGFAIYLSAAVFYIFC